MSIQTALSDVLNDLGIKREEVIFRRNGRIAYIKCPIHSERTASMRITPDLSYYCFGCGSSGNFRNQPREISYMNMKNRSL